jgi:lipopolysaccharide export system permease protein
MLYKSSLTKELFFTSLSTILILSGIVIAQRAVYIFRLAARGIIPNDTIDTVLVFNLLKHLPLLLSLTVFLAILLTLSRWYRDSEMIIWLSSGLSLYKFLKPILAFCFPMIILIASLSLYISPWAVQKSEEFKSGLKNRDELATISPGSFKESKSADRIFYVEGFSDLGSSVKNIFVQSIQNEKLGVIVSNKGKRFKNEDGENYIVMLDGKRYEGQEDTKEFSITTFKEYGVLIDREIPRIAYVAASAGLVEGIPTLQLLLLQNKANQKKYMAELMWRLSLPISAMILILLAISMSFISPRTGRSMNIISALLIFVIYNNLLGVTHSLVATGLVSFWFGFWPVHLTVALIGCYLLYRRSYNLPIFPRRRIIIKRKRKNDSN